MQALQRSRIVLARSSLTSYVRAEVASRTIVARTFSANAAPAKDEKPTATFNEKIDKTKLDKLSKEIMSLNLSETIAFINIMQDLLGLGDVRSMITANAGSAAAAPAASKADAKKDAAPAAPTKTIFELKLDSFEAGDKIKVIKAVREISGLGLKEAKDLVEGAPKVLMKEVSKEQGDQLIEKLKAAGGKASLV